MAGPTRISICNRITEKALEVGYSNSFVLVAGLALLTIVVGLFSGSYPAFFLSAFQPVKMLHGKFSLGAGSFKFRHVLVVFQFAITIMFIAGALIIDSQMRYVRTRKLGYDRENIVNVPIYSTLARENYRTYRNEILGHPQIDGATATSFTPSVERWREGLYFEGRKETDEHSFYRINISWWMFLLAGIAALLIALLTVSYQAVRAALGNPVESLRYE